MDVGGQTRPSGSLGVRKIAAAHRPPITSLEQAIAHGIAQPAQPEHVRAWKRENEQHLDRGLRDLDALRRHRLPAIIGFLWARVIRADDVVDLGLIGARVVTSAGVAYLVDAWQGIGGASLANFRYHGMGTGNTAEASSDTALVTELTTQYTVNSTRPTGTLAEAAANVFRSVATVTVDAAVSITEHGLFSQAATPGGTLWDRTVFASVGLAINESIEFTYDATFPAGG